MPSKTFSKEEIIEAIKELAIKLGRAPFNRELKAQTNISQYHVMRYFEDYAEAVRSAGLAPAARIITRIDDELLLQKWAMLARDLGHLPTQTEWRRISRSHALSLYYTRFGGWNKIPRKFKTYAADKDEWADVLALVDGSQSSTAAKGKAPSVHTPVLVGPRPSVCVAPVINIKLPELQTYGDPLDFRGLRHEPANEQGVIFLFGMIAKELGYLVEAVQQGFPDCDAKRKIRNGRWQRVRIEFEYVSQHFKEHGHALDGCDIIVCWRHNWAECPLEVVELSSVIKSLDK